MHEYSKVNHKNTTVFMNTNYSSDKFVFQLHGLCDAVGASPYSFLVTIRHK